MSQLILHGHPVSTFVRAARIAAIEKGVKYHFNEIEFEYVATDEYAKLHPFGKMPVLQQESFTLYETSAILGYIDEGFDGISLQPSNPQARAQMRKWIGIASTYLYPVGISQLFVQRIMFPLMGNEVDESIVASSAAVIAHHLDVLEDELTDAFLVGNSLSLADILTGTKVSYVNMTNEGAALIQTRPKTMAWLDRLNRRASFQESLAKILQN